MTTEVRPSPIRVGLDVEPLAVVVPVGVADLLGRPVVERDEQVPGLGREDGAQPLPDELDDGLEVELGGEGPPISFTSASSAARWSVSFSRRLVSSKRRAFSSATPMLDATVDTRRSSASLKALGPGCRAQ